MKHTITAEYKVLKVMTVEIPDDLEPTDPSNWAEIIDEQDTDCWLYDVVSTVREEI